MTQKSVKPLFSLFDQKKIEMQGKIIPHEQFSVLMEIEEILEESKVQAKELLENAQKEADELFEKAKTEPSPCFLIS